MHSVKTLILCAGLSLLAACDSNRPGKSEDNRGSEIIGNYRVSWAIARTKSDPLSAAPVFFSFQRAKPHQYPELPESAWVKEAARRNISVSDLKFMYGQTGHVRFEVYMTADGHIHSCTIDARKKGLCGKNTPKPLKLSIKTRAKLAQQTLEASAKCRWLGFDEVYNSAKSHWAGAAEGTLWARADCR